MLNFRAKDRIILTIQDVLFAKCGGRNLKLNVHVVRQYLGKNQDDQHIEKNI